MRLLTCDFPGDARQLLVLILYDSEMTVYVQKKLFLHDVWKFDFQILEIWKSLPRDPDG